MGRNKSDKTCFGPVHIYLESIVDIVVVVVGDLVVAVSVPFVRCLCG